MHDLLNRPDERHRTAFLLAILPFLGLVLWRLSWAPDAVMGDYAQYLLHTRALLDGRPYADIGYLTHPEAPDIGPGAYPPGLPLMLLPVVAIAGMHPLVLRAFSVACVLGFGWLAYQRLSRDLGTGAAGVGVAMALLVIEIQQGTVVPMSDPLFCVVLWLLFVVADTRERWTIGRTALVAALGFALVAVRMAGLAIGPALLLFGLLHWRRHGSRPFVVLATWACAALIAVTVVGNPYGGDVVDRDVLNLGRKLYFLAFNYRFALFEAELYPFRIRWMDQGYHVLVTPMVLFGMGIAVRRLGASLVTCFAGTYLALLLVVRVGAGRFLWPLLPLVGAGLVLGLAALVRAMRRPSPGRSHVPAALPRPAVAAPALLVLLALATQLGVAPPFAITGTPDADGLYAFMRQESIRSPVRAMFHNPRVLTLYSGVPAMGILDRDSPGQMAAIDAEHLTHVVWQRDAVSGCLQRILNALPSQHPDRFDLAFTSGTFRVFRVRPAAAPFTGPFTRIDWRHPPPHCVGA